MRLQFAVCACILFSVTNTGALSVQDLFSTPEKKIYDVTTTLSPEIVEEYEKKICANEPTCHLVDPKSQKRETSLHNRDCMCDADCVTYGDCCRDSKFYNATEQSRNHLLYYCSKFHSIYFKNRCPTNFTDADIIKKCHMTNATFLGVETDLVAPVTDIKTRRTYANKYCARCDNIDDYVVWNVTYYCFSGPPLLDNIEINDEESQLQKIPQLMKLNATDNSFYAEFNGSKYECRQLISQPSKLELVKLRKCRTTSVSCPTAYSDEGETIAKCHSYTSIVYDKNTPNSYRNKECAKCNGIPETNVTGCLSRQLKSKQSAFSGVFRAEDKAGGSDACGPDADAGIRDKFCR